MREVDYRIKNEIFVVGLHFLSAT